MQEIKIYIVLAVMVWLWDKNMFELLQVKSKLGAYSPRSPFCKYLLTHKPFNCGTCISFWAGILLTCITFNILFLTLPVAYKLLSKYL